MNFNVVKSRILSENIGYFTHLETPLGPCSRPRDSEVKYQSVLFSLTCILCQQKNKSRGGYKSNSLGHADDVWFSCSQLKPRRLSDVTDRSERLDVRGQICGNLRANSMSICRKLP